MPAKRNAKRVRGVDGTLYRSGFEAQVGNALLSVVSELNHEGLTIPYTLQYVPDFAPKRSSDGVELVIEAKGYFPPEDRRKMLAVLKTNPGLRERLWMVFQRPGMKIGKLTALTWCRKHNINACGVTDIAEQIR